MNKENVNQTDWLVELHGSGYELVKGNRDIRGWEVKDIQGRICGKVDELLFDKESEKVRYIVLDLKGNRLHLENRKVLIPIGLAELHEADSGVVLPEITAIHLTELPGYKHGRLIYDDEQAVRRTLAGLGSGVLGVLQGESADISQRSKFYDHPHFKDTNFSKEHPDTGKKADTPIKQTDVDHKPRKDEGHQGLIGEHDLS